MIGFFVNHRLEFLKQVELNRLCKFCSFFFTFLCQLLKLCTVNNITLISDNVGQLAIASYVGGCDWKYAIAQSSYYGWGYNWIFGLLFRITNNPYVIYWVINVFNSFMVSLIAVLVFTILEKQIKFKESWINCLVSIFVCSQSSIVWSTECSVFMATWVTVYILGVLFHSDNKTNKYKIFSALLGIWMCYLITLHERNMAIIFAVVIMYILFFLFERKKIFSLIFCIVPMLVCYPLEQMLKNRIIAILWEVQAKEGSLKNTTVFNGNQLWFFEDFLEGVKVMLEMVISNFYTMMNRTYGIFAVLILIVLLALVNYLRIKMRSKWKEKININFSVVCFIFSFFTTMIIIVGLAVQWGRGVYFHNYYSYKGCTYFRYYLSYIWPAVVCIFTWIYKERIKFLECSLGVFLLLTALFEKNIKNDIIVAQTMENRSLKLNNAWLACISGESQAEILSFLIVLILLVILCLKKKFSLHCFLLISIFLTIFGNIDVKKISMPTIQCSGAGEIYEVYKKLSNEELPQEIYTENAIYTLQYMLNEKTVIYEKPNDNLAEAIIFYNKNEPDKYGVEYKCFELDDNEYVFIKGERLIELFNKVLQ